MPKVLSSSVFTNTPDMEWATQKGRPPSNVQKGPHFCHTQAAGSNALHSDQSLPKPLSQRLNRKQAHGSRVNNTFSAKLNKRFCSDFAAAAWSQEPHCSQKVRAATADSWKRGPGKADCGLCTRAWQGERQIGQLSPNVSELCDWLATYRRQPEVRKQGNMY